ncbi:MAG TPA: DUF2169 domain-containing protein [Steroidobacteraceae bacterium]|nr:DUF2169 domain-containing protein [Steroidobacteraceae bacterium]
MPHAAIANHSPFALEVAFLADPNSRPLVVPLVQASYSIGTGGALTLAPEQKPPKLGGEFRGDPALASMKFEPQLAYMKLATDVVLLGHAHAPAGSRATHLQCGIRVGPVQKLVNVIGDRVLVCRGGVAEITPAQPFDRMPLIYERAFGGWDRRDPDPRRHRCERRNPVGTGFRAAVSENDELRMPNLEDPQSPYRAYGDLPPPAGLGFVGPEWQPRASFAGTYDEQWSKSRKPLLPTDFDVRFFNAATPGLIAPGHLRGDEPVVVLNAAPEGRVAFNLPGVPPPSLRLELRGRNRVVLQTQLDTVIVDMDTRLLMLLWRSFHPLSTGPHDVVGIELPAPDEPAAVAGH